MKVKPSCMLAMWVGRKQSGPLSRLLNRWGITKRQL